MAKASPADFAGAKRRALRALGQQAPDEFVPDRVMFWNEDIGFVFRLSDLGEDNHVQRVVPWVAIGMARIDAVAEEVNRAVERLARAQFADE